MNEVPKTIHQTVSNVVAELTGPLRSLQTARDAKNLASVTQTSTPEEEQRALDRLNKILKGNGTLRGDVPRGFYFNVRV